MLLKLRITIISECRPGGCGERVRVLGRDDDPQKGAAENEGGFREKPERHQNHCECAAVLGTNVREAG